MDILATVLQVIVALGLLNVWILRFNSKTPYRGGNANSMAEEFAAYGLPVAVMYVVGALKIGSAIALIVGIWFANWAQPAAAVITVLMLAAIAMHIKIGDPLKKSLPAIGVLIMTVAIFVLHY